MTAEPKIKVAFASGTDELNERLIERMRGVFPELPLHVVSEFPPRDRDIEWVRYDINQGFENLARCRAAFRGKSIRLAGVLLVPNVPFRRMRLLALALSPRNFLAVNENLNDFMLRPRSIPAIARHLGWRTRNFVRWHSKRLSGLRDRDWSADALYVLARAAGLLRPRYHSTTPLPSRETQPGVSLLIPSSHASKAAPAMSFPVETIELSERPDDWPEFADAVNLSLARARYSRVCLWRGGEPVDPDVLDALWRAFEEVPGLFCATPRGASGEPGSNDHSTYVLHADGGHSMYDAAGLRALGGFDRNHGRMQVGTLSLGYGAWQRGWPTVEVAAGPPSAAPAAAPEPVDHHYLNFLVQSVSSSRVFRRAWKEAADELRTHVRHRPAARVALRLAPPDCRLRGRARAGEIDRRDIPRFDQRLGQGVSGPYAGGPAPYPDCQPLLAVSPLARRRGADVQPHAARGFRL